MIQVMFRNRWIKIEANLQFYQGIQSALVRLKGRGLKAKITVYDTEEDSSRLIKLLTKPELLNQDLLLTNLGEMNYENSMIFRPGRILNYW